MLNSGFTFGFSIGHSAFDAGVIVTIVDASNVAVNVGMVGRGVGGRGVLVGSFARSRGVLDGSREEVALGMIWISVAGFDGVKVLPAGVCPQALRIKITLDKVVRVSFNVFLLCFRFL
jgi:hypothetical protein